MRVKATVIGTATILAGQSSVTVDIDAVDDTIVDGTQTVTITASAAATHVDGTDTVDVTDDDVPTLTLTIVAAQISENGGTTQALLERNDGSTGDLVVNIGSDDTTEASVPATVTIPDGASSVLFTVSGEDDLVFDGPQTPTITASLAGYVSGSDNLVVTDDEVATLTLDIDLDSMSENGGTATGTITRNSPTTADLIVALASDDTGEATVPATVTIFAGSTSATFPITAFNDAIADGTQTVTITGSFTGFVSGTDTIDVTDDEVAILTLDIAATEIGESDGTAATTATVTRNSETTSALVVTIASDDTSEATAAATVTIEAGETTATFDIDAVGDAIVDGIQTATFTASVAGFTSGTDSVDVTDDDVAALSLTIVADEISENGGTTTATVSRNTDTTSALVVNLFSSDAGEATVIASVTIAAGETTSPAFDINGADDTIVDGTQTVTIFASAAGHGGTTDTLDVTDDDSPELTVTIAAASVSEGAGAAATTATVSRNTTDNTNPLVVTLMSDDTTEATVIGSVTIAAGQTTSPAFDIDAINDAVVDGDQTVTITAAATGFANGTDTVDVTDDDTPTLALAIDDDSVLETAGAAATTATVTRNTDTTAALVVMLQSDDTGEATVPASVTILAGETSATFPIAAVDDALADGTQTVTLTASSAGFTNGTDTVDVLDVNEAPVINDATFSIAENPAANAAVGNVGATDPNAGDTLVYSITAGNGTGAGAFAIDSSGNITVADTSQIDFESTQSFTLTVEVSDGGSPEETDTATVTINVTDVDDTNDAPVVVLSAPNAAIQFTENDAPTAIIDDVAITDADDTMLSQAVVQITGNYLASEDFLDFSGPLPAGISSTGFNQATGSITLTGPALIADYITALKTITYENYTAASTATRTVTISVTDANAPADAAGSMTGSDTRDIEITEAALTLAIDANSMSEEGGTATGTVSRNTNTTGPLTVTLTSLDNSEASVPATVMIPAGQSSTTFPITAVDDAIEDGTQTVTIQAAATGFDSGTDTINVLDANEAPVLNDQTFSVPENAPNGQVIGVAQAIDPNISDGLTYSITAGNDAGLFSIDNSGQIFVVNSNGLDFETTQTYTLTVNVDDGGSPAKSDTATITINITDSNEAPTLLLGIGSPDGPVTYTQGDPPVLVIDNATITDEDDTQLSQAVVQITGNYVSTEDVLGTAASLPGSITAGPFNAANGSITLTGPASISDYITALRLITYENSFASSTATRTLTVTITDANAPADPAGTRTASATRDIEITQVFDFGDAPFQTLLADGGAQHGFGNLQLGLLSDFESDGQPNSEATGDGDDDDGIEFLTPIAKNQTTFLEVTASDAGVLSGWLDANQNGAFEASERFTWELAAGLNTVSFAAPGRAELGATYMRFRFSSDAAAVASPTGFAPDGEVEDYLVNVFPTRREFGDAPESYGTEFPRGAYHNLGQNNHWLGDSRTLEFFASPSDNASADLDNGVEFLDPIATRQPTTMSITASAGGFLGYWIDFDGSGTFEDSERFQAQLVAGVNQVTFLTPASATLGDTFARFRFSSDFSSVQNPRGLARDGEVEDYAITIEATRREFGDAPASYGTGIISGAYHNLGTNVHWLGAGRTLESNDNASLDATGDVDDGVEILDALALGQPTRMRVNASRAGELGYWVDFDGSGTFEADERFSKTLRAGNNIVSFITPLDAELGDTFARFRFSSSAADVANATGRARNGEVEDYAVEIIPTQLEFGDAPDSYGTTSGSGGAIHKRGSNAVFLGEGRTLEAEGTASAAADADTDDGIEFTSPIVVGQQATFTATASTAGVLTWWLDSDIDGQFDTGERFSANVQAGENNLSFQVPLTLEEGTTFMRFRFNRTAVNSPVGIANDGEVEDYQVDLTRTASSIQSLDTVFDDEDELAALLASL